MPGAIIDPVTQCLLIFACRGRAIRLAQEQQKAVTSSLLQGADVTATNNNGDTAAIGLTVGSFPTNTSEVSHA